MTITEQIKKAFDPYYEMPLEGWKTFTDLGEIVKFHKNDLVKEANHVERFLYFIVSGSGVILLCNKNNFVSIDLCFENDFFGDYMSFLNQESSPLEVVIFETSTLFRISKSNFDYLSFKTDYGDKICKFASEGLFIHKQQQQIDMLTKTSKER